MQEHKHQVTNPAPQTVLSGMRVTVRAGRRTLDGASRFVNATVCLVSASERVQSRQCVDGRVNGPNATAVRDFSTPLPSRFPRVSLLSI